MKSLAIRILGFILMLVTMIIVTMALFRTDYPYSWFIALLVYAVLFIQFPYTKYFKTK